jgi:hypothetical protein
MGAYIFDETTGTILAPCRLCGNRITFKVNVEGFRKWQQGEMIQRAMPELSVDLREMLISNTCGDCWKKHIEVSEDQFPVEDTFSEECLYSPMIFNPNITMEHEVPNELYINAMRDLHVGDKVQHTVSAPGVGFQEYMITRMDETGVWAILIRSTVRILELWEVI